MTVELYQKSIIKNVEIFKICENQWPKEVTRKRKYLEVSEKNAKIYGDQLKMCLKENF